MIALTLPWVASAQDTTIYKSVEVMPRFPGGEVALMKYIQSHAQAPEGTNANGTVILQFVVKADGSIGEVKVVRSIGEALDNEAVRVIKSLPNFIPGTQNGQPVAVWYTLPVRFGSTMGSPRHRERDVNKADVPSAPQDTTIYKSVEVMPRFPGGEAALMKYIQTNVQTPEGTDVQGVVILQFVVKADGSIGDVKVVRNLSEAHDKEAVRLIKSLPNFAPGTQNGQPVAVWYTLPVRFGNSARH